MLVGIALRPATRSGRRWTFLDDLETLPRYEIHRAGDSPRLAGGQTIAPRTITTSADITCLKIADDYTRSVDSRLVVRIVGRKTTAHECPATCLLASK